MNPRVQRLRADIAADQAALLKHAAALDRTDPSTTHDERCLAFVARSLHHAYCAIESILERIARVLDGGLPAGASTEACKPGRSANLGGPDFVRRPPLAQFGRARASLGRRPSRPSTVVGGPELSQLPAYNAHAALRSAYRAAGTGAALRR